MIIEPFVHHHTSQILNLQPFDIITKKKLVVGFTTKNGGYSEAPFQSLNLGLHVNDDDTAVVSNKEIIAKSLHFPLDQWVGCEQVHENKIVKVTKEHCGRGVLKYEDSIQKTDGIYTNESGIFLTLCFADCVPLYFYEPKRNLIGLAHAGWKGTVKDIAGEMIRKWEKEEGVCPKEVYVSIGPSIEECCYIVDNHVIDFVNQLGDFRNLVYKEVSSGQYTLSLKKLNQQLMITAGIPENQISVSSYCTSCSRDLFFSHRRDRGRTGRMLSFIGLKED